MGCQSKTGVLLLGLLLLCSGLSAQTFGEFFNQKKTQKRYLLEQIGALQLYLNYAKKGYELVGSGLSVVRAVTNGEFGLHHAFISSLKKVSPLVRNHVQVGEVIACQLGIIQAFSAMWDKDRLPLSNQLYIVEVRAHLLGECLKDLEALLLVVTSGKLEMSDAQRLERLDKIYSDMSDKYAFALDFAAQVELLISGRAKEQESIDDLRKLYEKE